MKITITPQVGIPGAPETMLHVAGDTISIDGTAYDLSPVPEGGEATEDDSPFIGAITRVNGQIHATVRVVLDETASDDQGSDPWIIPNATGAVAIPAIRKPVDEVTE